MEQSPQHNVSEQQGLCSNREVPGTEVQCAHFRDRIKMSAYKHKRKPYDIKKKVTQSSPQNCFCVGAKELTVADSQGTGSQAGCYCCKLKGCNQKLLGSVETSNR